MSTPNYSKDWSSKKSKQTSHAVDIHNQAIQILIDCVILRQSFVRKSLAIQKEINLKYGIMQMAIKMQYKSFLLNH